ncbi:MAG: hypothetical protein AVDCRST_MAG96-3919 [uncultured Segetibacter sp.]|uniref:Uncharacterized protein n=1 Tax=uncultured Segetibacter sp. TaxID=481133 RepID=A0A6J4U118_9BACT|nr:MAG: hypothetical protein AVDCRST_MAG96-3919 [uncultured Segetibacter sp.]
MNLITASTIDCCCFAFHLFVHQNINQYETDSFIECDFNF